MIWGGGGEGGGSSPRGGFGPRGSESGDTEAFFHTERIKLLRFRPLALFPVTLKAPLHRPCVYSWGEGGGWWGGRRWRRGLCYYVASCRKEP